jgi:hypothetical protein
LLPPWPAHRLVISPPALFEGKSLAAIAREEGVSRHMIAKQAKSDDVRQIVVAVVNDELERICQIIARMLRVIEEAFAARTGAAGRLTSGRTTMRDLPLWVGQINVMTAWRPKPKAQEPSKDDRTMTLAEFEALLGEDVTSGALVRACRT